MSPIQTIETFIDHWNSGDMDAMIGMLAEDIVWHNMPMEPNSGIAAVREAVNDFMAGVETCHWEIHAIAANGWTVLTERTDGFRLKSGQTAEIRVMGIFEIGVDGKITQWRDYFDMCELQRAFGGGS